MPRVMVLVHCTSTKLELEYLLSYVPDKIQEWKWIKGNNSKSMTLWIIVLMHCTSPQWDLFTYEVSCWCLAQF